MVCEMPGCVQDCCTTYSKSGIFHGVHLKTSINACDSHGPEEIMAELDSACRRASLLSQDNNPFVCAKNACRTPK